MGRMPGVTVARGAALILVPVIALILPACNGRGMGTLTPTVAPGIPEQVGAKNGSGRVLISWQATPAATSYRVKRSTNPGGPYSVVTGGDSVAGNSFSDTTVIRKTPYYYVVTARNSLGESGHSEEVRVVPNFTAQIISAGDVTSHALMEDGTVWGWGINSQGSLGIGVLQSSTNVAVELQGLTDVVALADGSLNCMALRSDGAVLSWGAFDSAPFPDVLLSPTPVSGMTDAVKIAAGVGFNLVLRSDGTVWAWGKNDQGQVGIDPAVTPGVIPAPAQIPGLTNIVAISAGVAHSLALRADGTLWGWGRNLEGQLGTGGTAGGFAVVQVANLTGVVSASAGEYFSAAIKEDGTVYTWGSVALGLGTITSALLPTQIPGFAGVAEISAGRFHCLALKVGGGVWGWGQNTVGQLGLGTTTNSTVPVEITALSGITSISAGGLHSLALGPGGSVWGWGQGGTAGSGTGAPQLAPAMVTNLTDLSIIASGVSHGMAVRPDGSVWTWGDNQFGQLGRQDIVDSPLAIQAKNLLNVTSIGAGFHCVARKSDGTVWAWGANQYGQIGQSNLIPHTIPFQVPSFTGVSAVAAGHSFTLALKAGAVYSFGQNNLGQLGLGITSPGATYLPTQIGSLSTIASISAGTNHALAIRSTDGTVWAWGDNSDGQLGGSVGPFSATPVQVAGLTSIQAVCAGDRHSLALLIDGTIVAWGRNVGGELGTSTSPPFGGRIPVPGLTGVVAIAAGVSSYAVLSDGTVWSWGPNSMGQLGDGTQNSRSTPAPIAGLPGVATVAAKLNHAYALRADGMMMAWGSNTDGEAGNGVSGLALTPTEIIR